jgi:hypothetical protein
MDRQLRFFRNQVQLGFSGNNILLPAAVVSAWLSLTVFGYFFVVQHERTPAATMGPAAAWPQGCKLDRSANKSTLVMFAHPHCPCTRASLTELNRLLARAGDKLTTHVLFVKPPGCPMRWVTSDNWRSAACIPGAHVGVDENGRLAKHFRAAASGHTFLYSADGRLLFSGGITTSRGHEGDNYGSDAVQAAVCNGRAQPGRSMVFGCSLLNTEPGKEGGKI